MSDLDLGAIAERLATIRARIDAVDRPFDHAIEIMAVTKGFGGAVIDAAASVGCTIVGENYAQDLLSKRDHIVSTGVDVHFIGQLQSNKVRQLADLVSVWESLDRASIIDEVAKRAPGARIMVQVDATHADGKAGDGKGGDGKGGCRPGEVADLVTRARDRGLVVDGLMTVGPTDQNPAATADAFAATRALVDELGLGECSMGMSGDLDAAVLAGTTRVRLGSALFGPRPSR